MERGDIALAELSGGMDLQKTLESGQTYLWHRDGMYADGVNGGGGPADTDWYHTVLDSEVLRVRQREDRLEWESTGDGASLLSSLLRLDDDLHAIRSSAPADPLLDAAFDAHRGMRLVRDPSFPCLISFICSAQMRVGRIYRMQRALSESFGETCEFDGRTYHAFPTPERLAGVSEAELRALGLGYRAPYVKRSAELVASDEINPEDARGLPYEEARELLTEFVGVGEKVADCVLLFSLGYLEAVPLDTWIRRAISEHYPDCDRGSYAPTSRAIRERLGGEYAGYAQTYLFHHLRTRG